MLMNTSRDCALVIGGSKGLGLATVEKIAATGYPVAVVHRDPRKDLEAVREHFEALQNNGAHLLHQNTDAIGGEGRDQFLNALEDWLTPGRKVGLVVFSIAKGNLKRMVESDGLTGRDLAITSEAMAFAFYDWARELKGRGMLGEGACLVAFTSEGSQRVLPAYGAVGTAKAALEALVRQMAVEWAPEGIRVNCLQAGVTQTDSLMRIPGVKKLLDRASRRNPSGRLTRPADVANAVYLLSQPEAAWITGNVLCVDGGERLC